MTIVDTHCHTGIHKYEPVEALLFHRERAGVDKAVLIQHAGETDKRAAATICTGIADKRAEFKTNRRTHRKSEI